MALSRLGDREEAVLGEVVGLERDAVQPWSAAQELGDRGRVCVVEVDSVQQDRLERVAVGQPDERLCARSGVRAQR